MKRIIPALCAAFFICVFVQNAQAEGYVPIQSSVADLQTIASGKIVEVLKPDLIKLDNNQTYRLDGIRIVPEFRTQSLAYLQDQIDKGPVKLLANPTLANGRYDRTGALKSHVVTADGVWIQEDLIKKGFGWADGTADNRDLLILLIKAENQALKNKQGLWSDLNHIIRTKDDVGEHIDSFQIVEGRAMSYKCTSEVCFVNFDTDFKKDFTISWNKATTQLFNTERNALREFDILTKKSFRIRGWVTDKNGPMITLEYPEQIEFLTPLPTSQ